MAVHFHILLAGTWHLPAIYQLNVVTGQRNRVQPPQRDVRAWLTD